MPVLIAIALVLVVLQPRISAYLTARREVHRPHGGPMVRLGVFGVGIYGGYFGGGQGIILFALLANSLPGSCSRSTSSERRWPASPTRPRL